LPILQHGHELLGRGFAIAARPALCRLDQKLQRARQRGIMNHGRKVLEQAVARIGERDERRAGLSAIGRVSFAE